MAADWDAMRAEYVMTSCTYAQLGKKHGLHPGTVRIRAAKEEWGAARKKYQESVKENTAHNTTHNITICNAQSRANDETEHMPERILKLQDMADMLVARISEALSDPHVFNRHLVRVDGEMVDAVYKTVDAKTMVGLTNALSSAVSLVRDLYGIPATAAQRDDSTGVIMLPERGDDG